MSFTKQEIGAILKKLREENGYTQKQVAEHFGRKQQIIGHWETGYSQPDAGTLFDLCAFYGADINTAFGFSSKKASRAELSPAVYAAAMDYSQLSSEHRKTVDNVISALLIKQAEEEKPVENVRFIDLFDMPVSAGNGVYLEGYDTHPIEIVNTPEAARADYALRVSGDSMEPMFSDGDIVLVETMPQIPQKAIGVFIHNGEGYIKQLDGPYMRSLNPAYEPILANSDTIIKGRVLGKAELV